MIAAGARPRRRDGKRSRRARGAGALLLIRSFTAVWPRSQADAAVSLSKAAKRHASTSQLRTSPIRPLDPNPPDEQTLLRECWQISHFGWIPEAAIRRSLTISGGQAIPAAALADRLQQLLKRGWAEQRDSAAGAGEREWRRLTAAEAPVEFNRTARSVRARLAVRAPADTPLAWERVAAPLIPSCPVRVAGTPARPSQRLFVPGLLRTTLTIHLQRHNSLYARLRPVMLDAADRYRLAALIRRPR